MCQMHGSMRWVWRVLVRSSFLRSVLVFFFFFCFAFHFLCLIKTTQFGRVDEGQDFSNVVGVEERAVEGEDNEQQHQQHQQKQEEPLHTPDDPNLGPLDVWIQASNDRKVFVYSAYLDRRGNFNNIRIITIISKRTKVQGCVVWTGNTTERVTAKTQKIRENWNLAYTAAFVLCHLTDTTSIPTRVAVVMDDQVKEASSLPVQDLNERGLMGNMSVCIKPFHYNFDRAVWLVEFIEFYRLLGADKFIFYNHTTGSNVEAVLRHYQDLGVATILPWELPVITQKEIRTEGIFAALNDCNMRSINRFPLSAMVDVDEFLIPRKHNNLLDLVSTYGDKGSTFIFQNVFFYLYWENDTAVHDALFANDNGLGYDFFDGEEAFPYLLTAFKTRRLNKPHKHGQRSKFIVRPEGVVEIGNHNVWEYIYGIKKAILVTQDVGLSHHYRICEFGGFDCLQGPNSVDRVTHKWLQPLVKRVANECTKIFPYLGSCPVAPPLGSPW
ncbi:beta-1,4-galactosyltransferase galt-1-like isoform X1 [Homarus americanus]|uniref:beta-1,4-galactosyltransferase galt-1-like isoform X1 n=1 Tax=Homarus americanus TaxID=6706 RepID=UPI001C43A899|nr:beta-1,4-galactosyltransferase galt-1-like isoform X1 [Homarus americanus]